MKLVMCINSTLVPRLCDLFNIEKIGEPGDEGI